MLSRRNNNLKLQNQDPVKYNRAEGDDVIYFNINIPFAPNDIGQSPAIFSQQLNLPIVYSPDEYYLAIVRFRVPTAAIPIFIAPIQPNLPPYFNTNVGNGAPMIFSVSLSFMGVTSPQTFVNFITTTPNAPTSTPLTPAHPFIDPLPFYYIFTYGIFIEMINIAFQTAFTALGGMIALPGGSVAPYLIFDPITERISLIAQTAFYDLALPTPIEVFSNDFLYAFLDPLPIFFNGFNLANGLDVQYNIYNQNNNFYNPPNAAPAIPPLFYAMTQEFTSLSNWNNFRSLQIVSNTLPIKTEFVPQSLINTGMVASVPILADFVPVTELGPEARTNVQFIIDGPWRFINMYGKVAISKIDISIYWTDQLGAQFPVFIPYNQSVTMKLMFIKKSIVSSFEMFEN